MVARLGPSKVSAVLCLLLASLSPAWGYRNATAADAVPNPMQAGTKFPQISQVLNVAQMFSPELVAYLKNPKTVCTVIAPDNKANMASMNALGQFSGLVLQNQSMVISILNYHIIPDQQLKAEDLGTKVKAVKTRQGELMYFVQHGGVPYVADGQVYVQPIVVANIPAGGCIIHIVDDELMAPPSLQPTILDWLTKAGNASALQAPKSLWLADLPSPGGSTSQESGKPQGDNSGGNSGVGAARASLLFVTSAVACALVFLGY